jgi:head-tail adaptor
MSARSRMTQRALVQRYTHGATDDSGNPTPGSWATHIEALACWLYGSTEREPIREGETVVVTDLRLMVPRASDVTEQDRIAGVRDRIGTVIEPGVLAVETVMRRRTHLELTLTRVSA